MVELRHTGAHPMTMKIFAATAMSTHDGKNANANMVGTYCSA